MGFRPVLAEAPPTATSNDQAEQATGLEGAPASVVDAFNKLDCTDVAARQGGDQAKPDEVVAACDREGTAKYILGATAVEGTDLSGAQAQLPRNSLSGWQVDLTFDTSGTSQFADITQQVVNLPPPGNQVAIVLDGLVVSAPRILEPITGGQAQITGTFTQAEANDLARVLQYGALPLAFDKSQISSISPTLGTDQLKAGLLAGAIGLTLVALYTLAYDRRLGLIAVASLAVAAAAVYGTVSLLGAVMNYRLSLVGIAGIIVAVGITADSFVVFFERVRDEIRDGRPQRTAVEYGWARARRTVIVADTVSLLAAAVLYLLSADQVRGFAFTLGLTTMIDVAVVFLFTKPVVTLATRTWLLRGRHSGLDPGSLGALFTEPGTRRPGLGARLYRGDTSIDVVGHWRRWAAISGVALALVLVGLLGRGLDLGVEFNGGAIFETREGSATIAEIRDAVEAQGVTEAQVRELSNGNILVEVGQVDPATAREIQNAVASTVGASPDEVKTDVIGPSWGADVTHKAELSLAIFLGLIIVYLSIAFEPLMAASAVIALLHDVLITVGVYALVGFTVTPATIIGVLTILGYSLYDTVVVCDKVKENTKGLPGGPAFARAANLALNQTLIRSINTSIIALLPVAGILFVGAGLLGTGTLQDLALALFVGIASGTYSSLFVAVPLLVRLKEQRRVPRTRQPGTDRPAAKRSRRSRVQTSVPMPEWDIDHTGRPTRGRDSRAVGRPDS